MQSISISLPPFSRQGNSHQVINNTYRQPSVHLLMSSLAHSTYSEKAGLEDESIALNNLQGSLTLSQKTNKKNVISTQISRTNQDTAFQKPLGSISQ